MKKERFYVCIDLKSFYASVECVERGLDPLTAKLVVADPERTDKTICLAVSPAMKELGVSSRCRVFEIPEGIEYTKAVPRMQLYMDYSARIYRIYLKYISSEDVHVYSIDEVFMDVTDYLSLYGMSAQELSRHIIRDVLKETGITATAGIGTNLYLAKIAMDILAKHAPDGIAFLDEEQYRKRLWRHRPLTDFWRIGSGTVRRLEQVGITTMKELAEADENLLYRLFGIDAELLMDHAWGRESATMQDIKSYRPKSNSVSSGQVLSEPYPFEKGKLIVKEMADLLTLELVERKAITDSITLYISYSGRTEHLRANGTITMPAATSSSRRIINYTMQLYERIAYRHEMLHRVVLTFNNITEEEFRQYDLFSSPEELEREHNIQKAVLEIKNRYGKNAVLKGMNLEEGAKTVERNRQIGGHKK
ncbi:MAG: Y-family DNA polymerase [Lachnospiraceae bacterium]|nr:Y-family DNA polymerase [Lachnospiraceae bacterium]